MYIYIYEAGVAQLDGNVQFDTGSVLQASVQFLNAHVLHSMVTV